MELTARHVPRTRSWPIPRCLRLVGSRRACSKPDANSCARCRCGRSTNAPSYCTSTPLVPTRSHESARASTPRSWSCGICPPTAPSRVARQLPEMAGLEDQVAAIAGAALVIAVSPVARALAHAFGVPYATPDDVDAPARAGDLTAAVDALDSELDQLVALAPGPGPGATCVVGARGRAARPGRAAAADSKPSASPLPMRWSPNGRATTSCWNNWPRCRRATTTSGSSKSCGGGSRSATCADAYAPASDGRFTPSSSFPRPTRPSYPCSWSPTTRREWVAQSLEALILNTPEPYELIVVDNDSTDGTREFLRASLRGARCIELSENIGFGLGNDRAALGARAPLLAFLNTDALVPAGWLPRLARNFDDPRRRRGGARVCLSGRPAPGSGRDRRGGRACRPARCRRRPRRRTLVVLPNRSVRIRRRACSCAGPCSRRSAGSIRSGVSPTTRTSTSPYSGQNIDRLRFQLHQFFRYDIQRTNRNTLVRTRVWSWQRAGPERNPGALPVRRPNGRHIVPLARG